MAGAKSKTLADATLALDTGASRWVALLTTLPTTNTGTSLVEVSGAGYARQAVAATTGWNATTTLADNITEQATNASDITFPQATGSWGTIVGWALDDAVSAGNVRRWGALVDGSGNPTTQAVSTGTTFVFKAGTLALKEQ